MLMKYPGGKLRCSRKMLAYAPFDYSEFRSPFCGNEPFLWHLDPMVPRWINDLDVMVYLYFVALRDDPTFIRRFERLRLEGMRSIDHAEEVFHRCIKRVQKDRDPVAYLYVRRLAHRQLAGFHRRTFASFSYRFAHRNSALRVLSPEYMRRAQRIMQRVKVTNRDYREVMDAPKSAFVFLDCPYYLSHHASAVYQHDFTLENREQLKRAVLACRAQVMLSVEDSAYSHIEYGLDERFSVAYHEYASCMGSNEGRSVKRDLIATTYNL